MLPKEPAAPHVRTVTPVSVAYEELLRQEPHVLEAVEKVLYPSAKKKRG